MVKMTFQLFWIICACCIYISRLFFLLYVSALFLWSCVLLKCICAFLSYEYHFLKLHPSSSCSHTHSWLLVLSHSEPLTGDFCSCYSLHKLHRGPAPPLAPCQWDKGWVHTLCSSIPCNCVAETTLLMVNAKWLMFYSLWNLYLVFLSNLSFNSFFLTYWPYLLICFPVPYTFVG